MRLADRSLLLVLLIEGQNSVNHELTASHMFKSTSLYRWKITSPGTSTTTYVPSRRIQACWWRSLIAPSGCSYASLRSGYLPTHHPTFAVRASACSTQASPHPTAGPLCIFSSNGGDVASLW